MKYLVLVCLSLILPSVGRADTSKSIPKIPPPDAAAAEVPAGYHVEVVVDRLMYPSSIEFGDRGSMYVAECGYMPGDNTKPARILRYTNGNFKEPEVVAEKLMAPITDLLWHQGKLYISHRGKISVLEKGKVRDLVTDLPSLGDHSNNQLAVGPDGKIYFGMGTATNSGVVGEDNFAFGWPQKHPEVCETVAKDITLRGQEFESGDPRNPEKTERVKTSAYQPFGKTVPEGTVVKGTTKANSTVLRMDADGSNLEMYAWGFRNPYGIQWGPDKQLYVADAGSDERGSRHLANAPEKLWQIKQGAWYGWPDYVAGIPVTDPRFKPKKGPAPQFLMKNHPPAEKPLLTFENHSSVTQLAFSSNDKFGHVGHLFVGSSGDQSAVTAAEEVRAGYWVKRIDPSSRQAEMFFRTRPASLGPKGLEYVVTAGPKRLVDIRFSPGGEAMYVVDIGPIHYVSSDKGPKPIAFPGTGVIWRISRDKGNRGR